MKLQLALDDLSLEAAIALVARVRGHIDIIEAGTPLIYGYGMEAVRALKARFPEKQVLADMKIMDSGAWETEEAMAAGADYVTVLGVSEDATVRNCLETAGRYGREVVVISCLPLLSITDNQKVHKKMPSACHVPFYVPFRRLCPSSCVYGMLYLGMKKPAIQRVFILYYFGLFWDLAEGRGFEPLEACTSTDFKSAAIDHSASPPYFSLYHRKQMPHSAGHPFIVLYF